MCMHAGGGFSPFITPVSTPRVASISRVGSIGSSDAGSTPRWASSSYGPVTSSDKFGKDMPRTAAVSLLASPSRLPAAIAGLPLLPASSPSGAASPGVVQVGAPRAPLPAGPRRTFSSKYGAAASPNPQQPAAPLSSSGQGAAPRRTRSNLSESPSQFQTPRHTSESEEAHSPLARYRRMSRD